MAVVVIAVLIIVVLTLALDSSQKIIFKDPTASPSSCKDRINEYLEKNRAHFDELGIDGPGTSGFIDCLYEGPSN
jgi:hypothetical protein